MEKLYINKQKAEQERNQRALSYKVQSFNVSHKFKKLSKEEQIIVKELQVGYELAFHFEQVGIVRKEIKTVMDRYLNNEIVKEEDLAFCKELIKDMKSLTDTVEHYKAMQNANNFLGIFNGNHFKPKDRKYGSTTTSMFGRRGQKEKRYG